MAGPDPTQVHDLELEAFIDATGQMLADVYTAAQAYAAVCALDPATLGENDVEVLVRLKGHAFRVPATVLSYQSSQELCAEAAHQLRSTLFEIGREASRRVAAMAEGLADKDVHRLQDEIADGLEVSAEQLRGQSP